METTEITMRPLPAIAAAPAERPTLLARLALWLTLHRERAGLSTLDDRLLRDVGLDPAAARRESARPFWDVPPDRWL